MPLRGSRLREPHNQQSAIVRRCPGACEYGDLAHDPFAQFGCRRIYYARSYVFNALFAEFFLVPICGFGDAVRVENERVGALDLDRSCRVTRAGKKAENRASLV